MILQEGVYIDDAGTPGSRTHSELLLADRISWAAVIITRPIAGTISNVMQIFLSGVAHDFGVNELHFSDIYSGRHQWKGVPVEKRIEIFNHMSKLFETFSLPVVFQTWAEGYKSDHQRFFDSVPSKILSWWQLNNPSHFSLFLTLLQARDWLVKFSNEAREEFPSPLTVVVDEGLAKPGTRVRIPLSNSRILSPELVFDRSDSCVGIQLADYAAFVISKTQWIVTRNSVGNALSDADAHIANLSGRINILNLPPVRTSKTFSKEGYEFLIQRDRLNKKLPRKPKSVWKP